MENRFIVFKWFFSATATFKLLFSHLQLTWLHFPPPLPPPSVNPLSRLWPNFQKKTAPICILRPSVVSITPLNPALKSQIVAVSVRTSTYQYLAIGCRPNWVSLSAAFSRSCNLEAFGKVAGVGHRPAGGWACASWCHAASSTPAFPLFNLKTWDVICMRWAIFRLKTAQTIHCQVGWETGEDAGIVPQPVRHYSD